jgi:hypothetical protein
VIRAAFGLYYSPKWNDFHASTQFPSLETVTFMVRVAKTATDCPDFNMRLHAVSSALIERNGRFRGKTKLAATGISAGSYQESYRLLPVGVIS